MDSNDDLRTPGGSEAPTRADDRTRAGIPADQPTGVGTAPASSARAAGTRASHTWVALSAGVFFLIVVLVFILQNLRSVRVHFFWATWTVPLAVDLLLAAVLGAMVMFAAGSLRIMQLRRAAKRSPQA